MLSRGLKTALLVGQQGLFRTVNSRALYTSGKQASAMNLSAQYNGGAVQYTAEEAPNAYFAISPNQKLCEDRLSILKEEVRVKTLSQKDDEKKLQALGSAEAKQERKLLEQRIFQCDQRVRQLTAEIQKLNAVADSNLGIPRRK